MAAGPEEDALELGCETAEAEVEIDGVLLATGSVVGCVSVELFGCEEPSSGVLVPVSVFGVSTEAVELAVVPSPVLAGSAGKGSGAGGGAVVPGVVVPGSVVPGGVVPGSVAPEVVVPGSVAPEVVVPGSVAPEVVVPGSEVVAVGSLDPAEPSVVTAGVVALWSAGGVTV
jgi:hypothetical protein